MIHIKRRGDVITFTGHTIPDVCSSVSSLMYATVNLLYKYDNNCVSFEDDSDLDYVCIVLNKRDNIIDMVIDNMFDMFKDLIDDNNEDKIELDIE